MRRSIHFNWMLMNSFRLAQRWAQMDWPEAHTCVPWCLMPFRQRSLAIVSLHHFCTSRSALPSAVESMYARASDKQHYCLIYSQFRRHMFLAGFVIILYDSAALQFKRFYLVLFWRTRCAVYEITEDLREDAPMCYPNPKTVQYNALPIRKSCF